MPIDAELARWCARPIEAGHPGSTPTPLVLGPEGVPVVTDAAQARRRPRCWSAPPCETCCDDGLAALPIDVLDGSIRGVDACARSYDGKVDGCLTRSCWFSAPETPGITAT
ncbi:hypothetical protein [Sorangium sp. So ce1335]|uniref:hypothetical protein n=1 Tax=Sorangium sp. So ce1335 TaxID=3133335 RepID=UPI003F5FB0DB